MIRGPMFEYTALVDAPITRFTGIVTGAEPDDAPLPIGVATPAAPVAEPAAAPATASEPPMRRPYGSRAEPASRPSLAPALLAVAAAGITAMWWLRRDHGPTH